MRSCTAHAGIGCAGQMRLPVAYEATQRAPSVNKQTRLLEVKDSLLLKGVQLEGKAVCHVGLQRRKPLFQIRGAGSNCPLSVPCFPVMHRQCGTRSATTASLPSSICVPTCSSRRVDASRPASCSVMACPQTRIAFLCSDDRCCGTLGPELGRRSNAAATAAHPPVRARRRARAPQQGLNLLRCL